VSLPYNQKIEQIQRLMESWKTIPLLRICSSMASRQEKAEAPRNHIYRLEPLSLLTMAPGR
jgi:hypothetical protein